MKKSTPVTSSSHVHLLVTVLSDCSGIDSVRDWPHGLRGECLILSGGLNGFPRLAGLWVTTLPLTSFSGHSCGFSPDRTKSVPF